MQDWPGLIEAYRSWLPVSDATPVISLREGATPLIPVPSVAEQIGKGVKGLAKSFTSGEGFVFEFRGPGQVWTQTRSQADLIAWLTKELPFSRD